MFALAAGSVWLLRDRIPGFLRGDSANSQAAVQNWLAQESGRAADFERFTAFLRAEGVSGAAASKHMAFAALDLATVDRQRDAAFFASLCAMQARAGPASRLGLGTYFDPADPDRSRGRFHIDGEGFRNWGFDYTSRSSPCPLFSAQETGETG